jgi:hypothetical protein
MTSTPIVFHLPAFAGRSASQPANLPPRDH